MDALERHKQRVKRMRASLERLLELHRQIHDLQGEIVAVSKGGVEGREERAGALHARVRELLPEVEREQRALSQEEEA